MLSIIDYIKHPSLMGVSVLEHFGHFLPDSIYLRIMFRFKMGYKLNLKRPITFSEKLQWLKLNNRKPEYTSMVDKHAVKEYVAKLLGEDYIIPTLGVWNKPDEIDWEKLPNQFVLKTTHGGGSTGVVICRDKKNFDKESAIKKLQASLNMDMYSLYREWPYKNVQRRVIAEKYIEYKSGVADLPDYKWYCFNGEPKYCQVIQNRTTKETIDFFDVNWVHQEFVGLNPAAGSATVKPSRPSNLEKQIRIAKELSKDIPFSRIDLYENGAQEYFGEITFYPMSGFGKFSPDNYNEILGQMLVLPGENGGGGDYQRVT